MGLYFNPGNDSFTKDTNGKIYIDKTGLLKHLNSCLKTPECCISLSHARRFGKSQAAGMITAYYSLGCDSKALFSDFEIASSPDFEVHLNKYNVIRVDVSSIADFSGENIVNEIITRIVRDFKKAYGNRLDYDKSINELIYDIYELSGKAFVIILDEWDCIIRNYSDKEQIVHGYLQFLHAIFKSEESKNYLALAYITGILPIKKIQDESALNNFFEYSMLDSGELAPFFGFTDTEVKNLCERYHMDYKSIKEWYDGYMINGIAMYNPNSVCQAVIRQKLDSFWKNTSSFSTINRFITLNYDGLKESVLSMLSGESVYVDVDYFKNDLSIIESKDDALTALIHLGYLAYDSEQKMAYVPNFEVATAYRSALKDSGWNEVANTLKRCDELLRATFIEDEDTVAEIIELAHDSYASVLKYNNENALSCVLTMAYFTAPAYYMIFRELPSGKGFADLVFLPRNDKLGKPAMIVELKWDKTADSAIRQIKDKRYTGALTGFSNILLVGITYDKASKQHKCVIEKFENR